MVMCSSEHNLCYKEIGTGTRLAGSRKRYVIHAITLVISVHNGIAGCRHCCGLTVIHHSFIAR
jgi:hypothetical protein